MRREKTREQRKTSDLGQLIILSGPSGVGKTTVAQSLLKLPGFLRVVTATTRAPRAGERDGADYIFLAEDEFKRRTDAGQFLEHARVHGNWYGTPRQAAEDALMQGSRVLLVIDVQGARQVRELAVKPGSRLPLRTIFLLPPSLEELEKRLSGRGTEGSPGLARRVAKAREEMEEQRFYDHRVVNHTVEQSVREILEHLETEKIT